MPNPLAHTAVEVASTDPCDICRYDHGIAPADCPRAVYDGKTKAGPWAFMCERCYRSHGVGLGLGLGQRLVVR